MDDAEYKRKLSQVAEWEIPNLQELTTTGQKKRKPRNVKTTELDQDAVQHCTSTVNTTYAPSLVSVRRAACTCEDCGRHCANGREKEARLYQANQKQVWRQKCLTCSRFQNPFNGEFELTGGAASIKFNEFMRHSDLKYNTPGNIERRKFLVSQMPAMTSKRTEFTDRTEIEDSATKIVIYNTKV